MQSEGVGAVHEHKNEDIKNGDEGETNGHCAEAGEDLRKPKPTGRPYRPTKTEVYDHEAAHLPYHSWC